MKAQLLASGSAMPGALRAQQLLADDWGVAADVWSVTSWVELHRDGLRTDDDEPASTRGRTSVRPSSRIDWPTRPVRWSPSPTTNGRCRSSSDPWVPSDYVTLGTDGFGLSDTRGALRRHFRIDAESITVRTLQELATTR